MLEHEMLTILRQRAAARGEDADKGVLREWRNHDIRRSCRSTLARLRIDADTAEAVLAHQRPGVRGIYDLWGRLPEKREALEAWSNEIRSRIQPQ